jgi:hypothetical protein
LTMRVEDSRITYGSQKPTVEKRRPKALRTQQ